MSEDMNLSINGQSQVPPGFRFHPTEEELLHYYLRKKVAFEKIDLDVIREVDLNKLEPWDIQEKCKIGSTPQNDWYFFSHKDKKYPTGTRTNRATAAGFWKATGRDKIIYSGFRRIGLRKTLVFYKGRAPHGQKSDWIMHEYRLDESTGHESTTVSNPISVDSVPEDGWVVCRVFKKKNYQKALDSPKSSSNMSVDSNNSHHHHHQMQCSRNDGVLDQILLYMGRTCKLENESLTTNNNISERFLSSNNHNNNMVGHHDHHTVLHERFMHLPRLESPSTIPNSLPINNFDNHHHHHDRGFKSYQSMDEMLLETDPHQSDNLHEPNPTNWVALDRLVASQLNGQEPETSKPLSCFGDPNMTATSFCSPDPPEDEDDVVQLSYPYGLRSGTSTAALASRGSQAQVYNENDLWSFARSSSSPSSSDPLCHLSV